MPSKAVPSLHKTSSSKPTRSSKAPTTIPLIVLRKAK